MSNACDACGYRDSEIKPGGGFSDKGQTITLQVSAVLNAAAWSSCLSWLRRTLLAQ